MKMTMILNEVKEAKKLLETGDIGSKPTTALFLLAKYYRQKENLNKKETAEKLNDFMAFSDKHYNPALWEDAIEDIARKAGKYPLREIDAVGITEKELEQIKTLNHIKYEKLAFVMLCHAKLHNMLSADNNGWVNTSIPEIYRTARVAVKYRKDKFLYLNDIEATGLISFSTRNDNLNLRVNFIDMNGLPVFEINDFRELGYEYLNYYKKGTFARCSECQKLYIRKTNNQKYCELCAKAMKMAADRARMAAKRKKSNSENAGTP